MFFPKSLYDALVELEGVTHVTIIAVKLEDGPAASIELTDTLGRHALFYVNEQWTTEQVVAEARGRLFNAQRRRRAR